jgi:hypothetical protein
LQFSRCWVPPPPPRCRLEDNVYELIELEISNFAADCYKVFAKTKRIMRIYVDPRLFCIPACTPVFRIWCSFLLVLYVSLKSAFLFSKCCQPYRYLLRDIKLSLALTQSTAFNWVHFAVFFLRNTTAEYYLCYVLCRFVSAVNLYQGCLY